MFEQETPLLSGDAAFAALRVLGTGTRDAQACRFEDVPFERLRVALLDAELTAAEHVVRLRHALRYADTSLPTGGPARTLPRFPRTRGLTPDALGAYGLTVRYATELEALPWRPSWLSDVPERGADYAAMRSEVRPWNSQAPVTDPWVRRHLRKSHYRGPGQALAVRAALHLPPNGTLVVVLPTGEGKSMVFEALARAHDGKTVAVVVPTVALALDHEARVRDTDAARRVAYIGGSQRAACSAEILASLREGRQDLLFGAPEAFLNSLREPLLETARTGRLAAVVVDEAHLVEAWGTNFRSEFQSLAAFVAQLRAVSPNAEAPRVVCLSATVNQIAFETLASLFSPDAPLSLVAAARLRPEPDIWIAQPCDEAARDQRVLDALRHLPRPAILYVTEVADAVRWSRVLPESGFTRLGVIHGKTPTHDRERVISEWRKGDLDLVVGTSAFGLGIDFKHIRTIIHACVPENLDRYYQEVGRAGRDDRSAIALLIPAHDDFRVAESLSAKRVITEEKGRARWEAMFKAAVRCDNSGRHRILVDVGITPGYDVDMKSERNEDWNLNVLNLMARAVIIRYAGLEPADDGKLLLAVDIVDERHREEALWSARVGPFRKRLRDANERGYRGVRRLLRDDTCHSALFAAMYALTNDGLSYPVTLACGGCRTCRRTAHTWFAKWPSAPRAPWPIGTIRSPLDRLVRAGCVLVEYPAQPREPLRFQRIAAELVEELWRRGLRKFIMLGNCPERVKTALESRPWLVAIGDENSIMNANGLPPGPEAVWIDVDKKLSSSFAPRTKQSARVLIAYEGLEDPRNPGSALSDRQTSIGLETLREMLEQ